jgi:hypothetical protein
MPLEKHSEYSLPTRCAAVLQWAVKAEERRGIGPEDDGVL